MTYTRPVYADGYSPVNTPEGVYPRALYHRVPDAMRWSFARNLVQWTVYRQQHFRRGGDDDHRRNVEIVGLDACGALGADLDGELRDVYRQALEPCEVEPFAIDWVEMNCLGYLDGDRFRWHTDHFQSSRNLREETKALGFIYYAHTEPRKFTGGGLEFADGTVIEPENDLLLFINPYQRHQVREVHIPGPDQWTGGRWTLAGWLHRAPTGEVPTWDLEPGAAQPLAGEGSYER